VDHAGAKSGRRQPQRPRRSLHQFGRYGGETGGTFKAKLQFVAADEDARVIGFHHNSAVRNGKRLDTDCCIVFELKDGRITSGTEHIFDVYNWDEFWS
jgi:ketosteroid isomerase-like protein